MQACSNDANYKSPPMQPVQSTLAEHSGIHHPSANCLPNQLRFNMLPLCSLKRSLPLKIAPLIPLYASMVNQFSLIFRSCLSQRPPSVQHHGHLFRNILSPTQLSWTCSHTGFPLQIFKTKQGVQWYRYLFLLLKHFLKKCNVPTCINPMSFSQIFHRPSLPPPYYRYSNTNKDISISGCKAKRQHYWCNHTTLQPTWHRVYASYQCTTLEAFFGIGFCGASLSFFVAYSQLVLHVYNIT
jgi:hypothetical protein